MASEAKSEVLTKIRSSDKYKSVMSSLRSKYDDVEEESSYIYEPEGLPESQFVVVMHVTDPNSLDMDLMFKIEEDGNVLDAEAEVDELSGIGRPQRVDEYLKRKTSIKDKIESFRDDKEN